jgi:probable HAF family extracellular repeat protein
MKSRMLTLATAISLFAVLALPTWCPAQELTPQLSSYTITDLGTLGGTYSWANAISNSGWVEGISTLSGDTAYHAFLWRNGNITDLGTLGGPNSSSGYFQIGDNGNAIGASDTAISDPLGEDFCGFGTYLICLPFVWQNGVMTPLPTLGGNNGWAFGVNNSAQVVGYAETATPTSGCVHPLEYKPVIWRKGAIHELPTFPGDDEGQAFGINDKGQAVGYSGVCPSHNHILLWQNGKPTDLGNLGGMFYNYGLDINNQGQVVGNSGLPPGEAYYHAFLWQNGVMSDLGTVPGDVDSLALGINSKGQVVGGSEDAFGDERAFIWQNGVMTDLNTLIPANSFYLLEADQINDRGQIVGGGVQISTFEVHAFLLTPINGKAVGQSTEAAFANTTAQRPTIPLSENARKLLQQRRGMNRFNGGLVQP